MSLLLDALKKAAQDKQQASSVTSGAEQNPDKNKGYRKFDIEWVFAPITKNVVFIEGAVGTYAE